MTEIRTTGEKPWGYKKCRCCRCGVVGIATPDFDFFIFHLDRKGPLYCLTCLHDKHAEWKSTATPEEIQKWLDETSVV